MGLARHGSTSRPECLWHRAGRGSTTSLRGLCTAFLAQSANHPEQDRNNPNFAKLASVAGGDDKVMPFCGILIGIKTHPSHPAPSHPTPAHSTKSLK